MPRNSGADTAPTRGNAQTITFGLVNVQVHVKSLAESKAKTTISQNFICPKHRGKIKTQKYCELCKATVDAIKAFPVNGDYVDIDEDTLDTLVAEKTAELEIREFVDAATIDPIYKKTSYLVYPVPNGPTATYDLLSAALRESGKAGVGRAVFARAKSTQLVVVRWCEPTGTLVAETCLYDNEIRWPDVDLVANAIASRPARAQAEIDFAVQILDGLAGDFDPQSVEDAYTPALRELLDQVAAGKPLPTPQPKATAPAESAEDLMATLKASVAAAKGKPAAATKKPAAKKPAAKKPRAKAAK